jgi:outer membrane protein OmpA-like peptidoglycan-associated protein
MKVVTRIMVLIMVVVLAAGCSTASKRAKCIAAGAAAGAAVGAGIGAVVGHQGDEDTAEGAAVGVAAGALVGGIIGAIVCKEEEPPPPPPPPAPVAEEPPPPPKVVEKIVLNGIQFDFDKAVIKDQYYPILDEGIAALEKHPEKKVAVEGYTCNIGTEDYNLRLSDKRAEAVKTYMLEKGIAVERLSTMGYGEANPVADNATREGREMNRRVEFKVMNGE